MKPSLRLKLNRVISEYSVIRQTLEPDYEQKVELLNKTELKKIRVVLDMKENALNLVWKEARPYMNPLEIKRYMSMIKCEKVTGQPQDDKVEVPAELEPIMAKIRKHFPQAYVYSVGKSGEQMSRVGPSRVSHTVEVSRDRPPQEEPIRGVKQGEEENIEKLETQSEQQELL